MPPEFDLPADLFTTNRAPDDGELALARALIHALENQRHGLTTAPALSGAEAVHTMEQSILKRLHAIKNVVAPIRRVPVDIIREIFLTCIEPDTLPSMSRNGVPCTLSHISGGLRQIALSTPALWAAFRVHITRGNTFWVAGSSLKTRRDSILRGKLSWLQQWIHYRSGNLPLRIHFSEYDSDVSLDSYRDIVNLVISCHARWRYISFRCKFENSPHLLSSLQSLTAHDVPQLRDISFGLDSDDVEDLNIFPMPLLGCPSLRKIDGVTFSNVYEHRSHILLSTITELTCTCTSWRPSIFADFATTLCLCISLVKLTINVEVPGGTELTIPAIRLPCLQHLSVNECFIAPRIFPSIDAPQLQTLELKLTYVIQRTSEQERPAAALVGFLKRSPNIQVLLLNEGIWADMVLIILRHCPRLVRLQLPPRIYHSSELGILLPSFAQVEGTEDVICPHLQYLDIGTVFRRALTVSSINTLMTLITRKLEPSSLLAPWKCFKVRIQHYGNYNKEEINQLLELADPPRITIESFDFLDIDVP